MDDMDSDLPTIHADFPGSYEFGPLTRVTRIEVESHRDEHGVWKTITFFREMAHGRATYTSHSGYSGVEIWIEE